MAFKPDNKGTVKGTKNNDKITWTNSKDWKKTLTVNADDGNDTIDFKKSTYKNNKLNGGNGNDTIYGGSNIDIIHGNNDNDKLYGYNGNDTLYGDAGNDQLFGGNGNDTLNGGAGNDTLKGEAGNDTLKGGAGNDQLTGGKGNDKLYTEAGNDTVIFNSGDGNDTLYKGSGSDTLQFNNFANISKLKSGLKMSKSGNNLVIKYTSKDSVTLSNYFKNGTSVTTLKSKDGKTVSFSDFFGSYMFNTYTGKKDKNNSITGSDLNDLIKGNNKNDTLNGKNGNDKIYGYAGTDTIKGGNGNDYIEGGDGNDKLYGEAGNDTVKGGAGNDTIEGGAGNDKLYGDAGNDTIKGGAGNDTIEGGDGNDKLYGEAGNDTIKGGAGNDYIDGGDGNDKLYGEAGNDTIKGGAGNDTIEGGAGNDKLYGDAGNDTINAGGGTNTIYFGKNEGTDTIQNGGGKDTLVFSNETDIGNIEFTYGENDLAFTSQGTTAVLENYREGNHSAKYIQVGNNKYEFVTTTGSAVVIGTEANDVLFGTDRNDYMSALDGDDILKGGAGNDRLIGGTGNDRLYGGTGYNTLVFSAGDGNDIVYGADGEDTLEFTDSTDLEFEDDENGKDLVIRYNHVEEIAQDSVTIKNYYDDEGNPNSSVKFVRIAGHTIDIEDAKQYLTDPNFSIEQGDFEAEEADATNYVILASGNEAQTITTKDGNDVVFASETTVTTINTGNGDDTVHAGFNSSINTGAGNDTIYGGNGGTINSGSGEDEIHGGNGDIINAGADNDTIYTGNSTKVDGGEGNDTIILQQNSNEIHFGENYGQDTVVFEEKQENGNTVVFDNKTLDEIQGENGLEFTKDGDNLVANFKNDNENSVTLQNYFDKENKNVSETTVKGSDGATNSTTLDSLLNDATITVQGEGNVEGTKYKDDITGSNGADTINAGAGNDALAGGGGDDILIGGTGNDTLTGGIGANTFVFQEGDGNDTITDAKKEDTIQLEFNSIDNASFSVNNENKLVINFNDGSSITSNFDYSDSSNNIDTILVKDDTHVGGYREVSIKDDIVFEKTLADGANYAKTTPYNEQIIVQDGYTATVSNMGANDSIKVEGEPTYSRTNNGGLVINDALTVTDFNFDGTHDINVNGGTTANMTVDVTLTDNFAYTSSGYNENISGTGSVTGLTSNDKVTVEGDTTYSRTNDGGLVVTGSTSGAITVSDFNFDGNHNINVNDGTTAGMTVDVTLTDNHAYTSSGYSENISGTGSVTGLGTNDKVTVEGDATYSRTNDGGLVVTGSTSGAITVSDFNFDGNHNINVNDGTTEGMTVDVTLTDNFAYTSSGCNENISGTGSVTGLGVNDKVTVEGDTTYSRTNDGALVVTGSTSGTIMVTDFNFDGNHDINVNDGTTAGMTVDVTLTGGFEYTSSGYNENISGNGSVTGLTANDRITFANEADLSYTLTNNGLSVTDGVNTIIVKDNHTGDLSGVNVYTGNVQDDVSAKELTVIGVTNFDGSDLDFATCTITGSDNADNLIGGEGNDTINGGAGADTLVGGLGNDTLTGGDGADTFVCNAGTDTILDATSVDNIKIDVVGNVEVTKNAQDKLQITYNGGKIVVDNYVIGAENNVDTLFVKNADGGYDEFSIVEEFLNPVNGTEGGENLVGTTLKDIIDGKGGNDTLTGNGGKDTFIFKAGDGQDVITDATSDDTIKFTDRTNFLGVTFARINTTSLLITSNTDSIEVQNYFTYSGGKYVMAENAISSFILAGGETPVYCNLQWIDGAMYNVIEAADEAVTLSGIAGIANYMVGSSENDTITGNDNNDIINGGTGNDILTGGMGNDTFIFSKKDGNDVITDATSVDKIVLADKSNFYNVTFIRGEGDSTSLFVKTKYWNSPTNQYEYDTIEVQNYFTYNNEAHAYVMAEGAVTQFGVYTDDNDAEPTFYTLEWRKNPATGEYGMYHYVEGTEGADQLGGGWDPMAPGWFETGAGNDFIQGHSEGNVIYAGTGDDTILGEEGNDVIYGEAGDDKFVALFGNNTLYGGDGSDKYYLISAYGPNVIKDATSDDKIIFMLQSNFNNINFTRGTGVNQNPTSLYITYTGANQAVAEIENYFVLDNESGDYIKREGTITQFGYITSPGYDLTNIPEPDQYYTFEWRKNPNTNEYGMYAIIDTPDGYNQLIGVQGISNYITGDGENNRLYGKDKDDILAGGDGADQLSGGAGNDVLFGGDGNDIIVGESGNDYIDGGVGADQIDGGVGSDVIYGGDGADIIIGGDGNDSIYGGAGNDQIWGSAGNDTIDGGDGNDQIDDVSGTNTLSGGAGDDIIIGGTDNDTINGGADNDVIVGDYGNDTLTGGDGADKFYFYPSSGKDVITDAESTDKLIFVYRENPSCMSFARGTGANQNATSLYVTYDNGTGNDVLEIANYFVESPASSGNYVRRDGVVEKFGFIPSLNVEELVEAPEPDSYYTLRWYNDSQTGVGAMYNVISGTDGDNTLNGLTYLPNWIEGGNGNDTITGSVNNDYIDGGLGNDAINAGAGINTIHFALGDGDDTIANGGGTDVLLFDEGTSVIVSKSGNNMLVTYSGTVGETPYENTITLTDYYGETPHSVQTFQIGTNTYSLANFRCLSRGDEALVDQTVTAGSPLTLVLSNPFGGSNYMYSISTDESTAQTFSLEYLANGRLVVNGDNINVTANSGQADDIIIWGDNNYVETGDGNDIVRIGGAMDGYLEQSNSNIVDTGSGDDHVIVYGVQNIVDTGAGTDSVIDFSNNELNTIENAEFNRYVFANEPYASVNGTISTFNQSLIGDCRVFAIVESLNQKGTFSDAVTITPDGDDYTVRFNNYSGATKQTTVTRAEIDSFDGVNGDIDVVLTDIALNKLLKQNGDGTYARERSYAETATYNVIADYFYGQNKMTVAQYSNAALPNSYSTRLEQLWAEYSNPNGDINNLTVAFSCEDNYNLGIISGHAYTIKNYVSGENGYISLINPWNNKDVLNLDLATFYSLEGAVFSYGVDYYHENYTIHNLSFYDDSSDKPAEHSNATTGNDLIIGGEVNDIIDAKAGDDVIIANEGNDRVTTGAGNDRLYFQTGDGRDVITDASSTDKIIFAGENLSLNSLSFARGDGDSTSLFVTYGNDPCDDVIEIQNYFTLSNEEYVKREGTITQFGFVDSMVDSQSQLVEPTQYYTLEWKKNPATGEGGMYNIMTGTGGANTLNAANGIPNWIEALAGNDTLYSGTGNDVLSGGAGNDTFRFSAGGGNDTVVDATKDDVIQIDSVTGFEITKVSINEQDKLQIAYNGGRIIVDNYVFVGDKTNNVDTLKVKQTDGSYQTYSIKNEFLNLVEGTDGYDYEEYFTARVSDGKDLIDGKKGNDSIVGGGGADIFVFKAGDGKDYINDATSDDAIKFTDKTTFEEIQFQEYYGSLRIIYDNGGWNDYITLPDYFKYNYNTDNNVPKDNAIHTFILAGGDSPEYYNLRWINGAMRNVFTGDGTEPLTNTAVGVPGAYIFSSGNGHDVITNASSADCIEFATATDFSGFSFARGEGDSTSLFITYAQGDVVEVQNYFTYDEETQDYVMAEGSINQFVVHPTETTTESYNLEWHVNPATGVGTVYNTRIGNDYGNYYSGKDGISNWIDGRVGNDNITGSANDDVLLGGEGQDYLYGRAGNDYIDGGADNDTLEGNDGNDTILGGEGNDTLRGNDGDDVLWGGKGDDNLYGNAGNNTICFNLGDGDDTVYSGTGTDTLKFAAGTKVLGDLGENPNDMVLRYSGTVNDELVSGTVTIKNYFTTQNHSVKYVQIGDAAARVVESYMPTTIELSEYDFENLTFERGAGNSTDLLVTKQVWSNEQQMYIPEVVKTVKDYFIKEGGKFVMSETAPYLFKLTNGKIYHLEWRVSPANEVEGMYHIVTSSTEYASGAYGIMNWIEGSDKNNSLMRGGAKYSVVYSGDKGHYIYASGEIFAGGGNDEIIAASYDDYIEPGAGVDTISPSGGNNTIVFHLGESDGDIVDGYKGKDTLVFDAGTTVSVAWGTGTHEDDMLVTCTGTVNDEEVTDTIILKDYKTNTNGGSKYIKVGNGAVQAINAYLPAGECTNGDDLVNVPVGGGHFDLKAGNDTLNFGQDFGNVTLDSTFVSTDWPEEYVHNANRDTLNLQNYSISDGTLNVTIDGEGDTYNMVLTAQSQDGQHGGTITVNNFASNNETADFVINDADTTWYAYGYSMFEGSGAAPEYNNYLSTGTTSVSQAGKNNIFIIKNERDDQIYGDFYFDSSSSAVRKNVVATSGNINLNYILNPNNRANDKVYTVEGDDTYQIGNLTNDTRVTITDIGGTDTLGFAQNIIQKIRLLFNVNADGTYDNVNMKVVHANMINATNFKSVYNSSELGVNIKAQAGIHGNDSGIERIVANGHTCTNVTEWKTAVANTVAAWLTTNGYTDVEDALNKANSTKLSQLYNLFNQDYASNLASTVISSANSQQLIAGQIWPSGNNLFGTDGNDYLLGTDVSTYISQDVIYAGKGDDIISPVQDRVIWYNGLHTAAENFISFRPGDGNDTLINTEQIAKGDTIFSKSDEQVLISQRQQMGSGFARLNFIGIDANNLSARQDGNDIVITYKTKNGNTVKTSDTIRIVNGFYSTGVNELYTWEADPNENGGVYTYGDGDFNDWFGKAGQITFTATGYGTKHVEGSSTPTAQLTLQDILTVDAIDKSGATSGQEINAWMWNDTITGSAYADTINGYAGDDHIEAGAGDDTIYGNYGHDTIYGGAGNDLIYGDIPNPGRREYIADSGREDGDTIYGGDGDDRIYGASTDWSGDTRYANSEIHGGAGNDKITGAGILDGGDGDDFIKVNARYISDTPNVVSGGSGNDTIVVHGMHGIEATITGGAGNDKLYTSSSRNDYMEGDDIERIVLNRADCATVIGSVDMGSGKDYVRISNTSDALTIDGGTDDDVIEVAAPNSVSDYKNLVIKNSGGHDAVNLASAYQKHNFDYYVPVNWVENQGYISEFTSAPIAFFDMTINKSTGAITSVGNDIYICTTAPGSYDEEMNLTYMGDKNSSIKFENALVSGHGMDIYIKNNESGGYYQYGSEYHYKCGYRVLNVERLKERYAATLKTLGYSSLSAALSETNATKLAQNRTALAADATAEDVWVYTLERPLEFTLESGGYPDAMAGNGQNNALLANFMEGEAQHPADNFYAGSDANEFLYSTLKGNDILKGGGGNDVLFGGRGDDKLYGGAGDDTFVFCNNYQIRAGFNQHWSGEPPYGYFYTVSAEIDPDSNDGNDIVYKESGNDTLEFAECNMVKFAKDGRDLKISYAFDENDEAVSSVTVKDYFLANGDIDANHSAKYIKFKSRGVVNLADEYNDYVDGGKYVWGTSGNDNLNGAWSKEYIYGGAGNDTITAGAAHYLDGGSGNDTYMVNGGSANVVVVSDSGFNSYNETNTVWLTDTTRGSFRGFYDISATKSGGDVTVTYGDSLFLYNDADFDIDSGVRVDLGYRDMLAGDYDTSAIQNAFSGHVSVTKDDGQYNTNYQIRVEGNDEFTPDWHTNVSTIIQQTQSWLTSNYDAVAGVLGEGNVSTVNLMTSTADGAAALQGQMIDSINNYLNSSYYGWSTYQ